MLTTTDIKKLKTIFATKKDLEKFATKKDLEKFATKKDLEKYATKKDLEKYATKKDLEVTTQDILDLISAFRKELKGDILSFKDEILYEIKKLREDVAIVTGYREMIEDHEQRIVKLETQKSKVN